MRVAENGYADIVQMLLSAGANIEAADEVLLMIYYSMAASFVLWSKYLWDRQTDIIVEIW